jgi:hypothetical protein
VCKEAKASALSASLYIRGSRAEPPVESRAKPLVEVRDEAFLKLKPLDDMQAKLCTKMTSSFKKVNICIYAESRGKVSSR